MLSGEINKITIPAHATTRIEMPWRSKTIANKTNASIRNARWVGMVVPEIMA